jgi:hypothetical protein
MTETWCRGCKQTVHITHSDDECEAGNANLKVPSELKASRVHEREAEEKPGSGW